MFCVSFYLILYDVSIDMCVYKSTWFNVNDHILKQMAAPMPMTNAAQLSVSNIFPFPTQKSVIFYTFLDT